jgi:hypothetical protein
VTGALQSPETRAMEAGEQAYPGDPWRGAAYAEGYFDGWMGRDRIPGLVVYGRGYDVGLADRAALEAELEAAEPGTVYGSN